MVDYVYDSAMRQQALSIPSLLKQQYEDIEPQVRKLFSFQEIFSLQNIIFTGCGDSYVAGWIMQSAFRELTGMRTEVVKTVDLARYYPKKRLGGAPMSPLVIAVSNSGKVARLTEAVMRARQNGAYVLAVTGDENSPLAMNADRISKLVIPKYPSCPGTRSYAASLLALYLLGIRIGEVRGKYTMDQAKAMRKEILVQAEQLESLMPTIDLQMQDLAGRWKDLPAFDFIGGGIDEATAFFSMAKVYEAIGKFASCVNIEEWLHLNFFMRDRKNIATILIASSKNAGQSRIRETLGYIHKLERPLVVISDKGKDFWQVEAEYVMVPTFDFEYSFALTSFVPICLLLGNIQTMIGEVSGRGKDDAWSFTRGAKSIRESEIVIL